jgi:hypothetical protein
MITRKPYVSDEPTPVYHHDIVIDGMSLSRNQECTLERGIGYPAGRYLFQYAEELPNGEWVLTFFGPSRRARKRHRQVWRSAAAVRTIHQGGR